MNVKVPRVGRKPGAKNVMGKTAKENLVAVFTRLGGTAAMAKWAAANETEFYKLYGRLIPVENQVSSPTGGPVEHKVTVTVD